MGCDKPVLALYDFRSKQGYIYRTNRMREITGASELIATMYRRFLSCDGLKELGIIRNDWQSTWDGSDLAPKRLFDDEGFPVFAQGEIGIVVYEGGGNLCVLYFNRKCYLKANRVFSQFVLREAYTLNLVVGSAEWQCSGDPDLDFRNCRDRAYQALEVKKRVGSVGEPCNVLPFTQVDAVTFQPIVERRDEDDGVVELSREALCKRAAYGARGRRDREWLKQGKHVDNIGTKKGEDSLVAVIYFDGNDIGDRLKREVHSLDDMRVFSHGVHEAFVTNAEERIRDALAKMPDERQRDYRFIVDHGDEITLVCNAHAAPIALDAYFTGLDAGYTACAGMAVCHAHDPFSAVYRMAEQCCENGKALNRARRAEGYDSANYVDFHFCRAGITGSLAQIRDAQEVSHTLRPYQVGKSYEQFLRIGERLASSKIKRSDLKGLGRAILRGTSWYLVEYERIKSKDADAMCDIESILFDGADAPRCPDDVMRKLLFDLTGFLDIYDVRFSLAVKDVEVGHEQK